MAWALDFIMPQVGVWLRGFSMSERKHCFRFLFPSKGSTFHCQTNAEEGAGDAIFAWKQEAWLAFSVPLRWLHRSHFVSHKWPSTLSRSFTTQIRGAVTSPPATHHGENVNSSLIVWRLYCFRKNNCNIQIFRFAYVLRSITHKQERSCPFSGRVTYRFLYNP